MERSDSIMEIFNTVYIFNDISELIDGSVVRLQYKRMNKNVNGRRQCTTWRQYNDVLTSRIVTSVWSVNMLHERFPKAISNIKTVVFVHADQPSSVSLDFQRFANLSWKFMVLNLKNLSMPIYLPMTFQCMFWHTRLVPWPIANVVLMLLDSSRNLTSGFSYIWFSTITS